MICVILQFCEVDVFDKNLMKPDKGEKTISLATSELSLANRAKRLAISAWRRAQGSKRKSLNAPALSKTCSHLESPNDSIFLDKSNLLEKFK